MSIGSTCLITKVTSAVYGAVEAKFDRYLLFSSAGSYRRTEMFQINEDPPV